MYNSLGDLYQGLEFLQKNATIVDCKDRFNDTQTHPYRDIKLLVQVTKDAHWMICELTGTRDVLLRGVRHSASPA